MVNINERLASLRNEISENQTSFNQIKLARERSSFIDTSSTSNLLDTQIDNTGTPPIKLIAQGDSWFNYWIGQDVLYWLRTDFGYDLRHNISVAGSTLNDIVYGPVPDDFLDFRQIAAPSRLAELVACIDNEKPDVLLLSAGGNDVAGDDFFSFLNNAKSGITNEVNMGVVDAVVSETFEKAFRDLIEVALHTKEDMMIFTHGYDYPWPDGRGVVWIKGLIGPWFHNSFNAKNYPYNNREDLIRRHKILRVFIDALNVMILKISSDQQYNQKVHFVDLRNTLKSSNYLDDWANELHPTNSGFRQIAAIFDKAIRESLLVS